MTFRMITAALTASTFLLSGCATLLSHGRSELEVSISEPSAHVTTHVSGVSNSHEIKRDISSFKAYLDRTSDYQVEIHSPGYEPQRMVIKRDVNPYFWGNLVFALPLLALGGVFAVNAPQTEGAAIGLAVISVFSTPAFLAFSGVDVLTGNMWKHDKVKLEVQLKKE